MGEKTAITWTGSYDEKGNLNPGSTWNPWLGCKKVSAGCTFCYMYRDIARFGGSPSIVRRAAKSTFDNPIKWKALGKLKPGSKIFTCSLSDWFIEDADAWRDEAWEIIRNTPEYIYLILTKREKNIESRLPKDWGKGWNNVWLGITTENQHMFDTRIEQFRRIPAKIHFLSVEPMLSELDITKSHANIDWVITGGESERTSAREMRAYWAISLRAQCKELGIPFFHKQMGSYWAKNNRSRSWKGDDMSEWPEELRVREFPNG